MANLVVCEGCSRHVRRTDDDCPFCGRSLADVRNQALRPMPTARLSRAALLTFTAASIGAASCGGESSGGDARDGGEADGSFQPLYGGPPSGGAGGDIAQPYGVPPSGGTPGAGGTTGSGGFVAPPYGIPPWGGAFGAGGDIAQPYGVPPSGGALGAGGDPSGTDAGTGDDAGMGGTPPAPPYGISPFRR